MKQIRSFVGMDVHKATISISVAEDGRNGPVRFIGVGTASIANRQGSATSAPWRHLR
jgi:hypothetical protein